MDMAKSAVIKDFDTTTRHHIALAKVVSCQNFTTVQMLGLTPDPDNPDSLTPRSSAAHKERRHAETGATTISLNARQRTSDPANTLAPG